jgi:acetyl-CoA/propionyl-CoA carboxylase biotin carboxyl carrier protein
MARRFRIVGDTDHWTAEVDGAMVTVGGDARFVVHDEGDGRFRLEGDASVSAIAAATGDVVWVAVQGHPVRLAVRSGADDDPGATRDHDALSAPMPATVVRIAVAPGDRVRQGDLLVVLEAMKMELPVRAPRDMTIAAVHCREGELVQPGQELVAAAQAP